MDYIQPAVKGQMMVWIERCRFLMIPIAVFSTVAFGFFLNSRQIKAAK